MFWAWDAVRLSGRVLALSVQPCFSTEGAMMRVQGVCCSNTDLLPGMRVGMRFSAFYVAGKQIKRR